MTLILAQELELDPRALLDEIKMLRYIVDKKAEEKRKIALQDVLGRATPTLKFAVQAASERSVKLDYVYSHLFT